MTSADRIRSGRLARLSLWNRLFRGLPVSVDELDPVLLCGNPSSLEERGAYTTLRACVVLSNTSRQAVRCALRVAILYWFSNVGEQRGEARASLEPRRSAFHLGEAIGTGMTWDEAVAAMKRKPIDFSAYLRILEIVHGEYVVQWDRVFPGTPTAPIDILAGNIRDDKFARNWQGESPGPESRAGDARQEGGEDDGRTV